MSVGASSATAAPAAMTTIQIPCCLCGTMITPNAANQCGACLAQQFDLKGVLQRGPGGAHDITVHQCRRCRRYERPSSESSSSSSGGRWEYHEPESPELLALCLKHIPALRHGRGGGEQHAKSLGVGKVHVVDAMWVWTEPHSMRLKVRLTVRAEVGEGSGSFGGGSGTMVQQRVLVEMVVKFSQCPECNREFTNRTWHAVVQLRQKRTDGAERKGLILLETALSKNAEARKHVLSMETTRHGFDFYFLSLMHAKLFSSYLGRVCPMRTKTTQKLVSSDVKNNTANMKYTVSCDVVPLCRDDLIIVDKRASHAGGGAGRLSGRLCLVNKVSGVVQLVDASPARSAAPVGAFADVPADKYWKGGEEKSYRIVFSSKRLVRFVVLDVELCVDDDGIGRRRRGHDREGLYQGPQSGIEKYALADVEVVREADFGQSDQTYRCVTHLGNLLEVGDVVLGYDLVNSVLPSDAEWSMENSLHSAFIAPDVVLVKKGKGGGASVGSGIAAEPRDEERKPRAKSSGSKRRERRRKREEKKMKALEEAAARMGFLHEEDGNDYDNRNGEEADNGLLERDRSAFERELENDPELARELEMAEKELSQMQEEMDATGEEGAEEATEEVREGYRPMRGSSQCAVSEEAAPGSKEHN